MQTIDQPDLRTVHVFDGDDIDAYGPPAPDGTTLTPAEIQAVHAAQAAATEPSTQAG